MFALAMAASSSRAVQPFHFLRSININNKLSCLTTIPLSAPFNSTVRMMHHGRRGNTANLLHYSATFWTRFTTAAKETVSTKRAVADLLLVASIAKALQHPGGIHYLEKNGEFIPLSEDVLVEMVKLAQKKEMAGSKGRWKEFLKVYDKKYGTSLSDPSRRNVGSLDAFLKTFTKSDDLKFFKKVLQCHSNRDKVEQFKETFPDETAEQKRRAAGKSLFWRRVCAARGGLLGVKRSRVFSSICILSRWTTFVLKTFSNS